MVVRMWSSYSKKKYYKDGVWVENIYFTEVAVVGSSSRIFLRYCLGFTGLEGKDELK